MQRIEQHHHSIKFGLSIGYTGVFLICLIVLTFWIRIQGADTLPTGQFTGNDAYLFHSQAKTISENGSLPDKDMNRWLPYGRDNGQILTLYSYFIAYIHKILTLFLPDLTLYAIQLYLPPICFTLGIAILFLFLGHQYGRLFAIITCVLLATLPGSVERSAIGFGDRDAWCWLFGALAVVSYLFKEQQSNRRNRYIFTILSGISVLFGGLSWGAFGIFLLIPIAMELWKFCTTETEENLSEYLLWVATFVPLLYLLSPIYRQGTGFTTHIAALTLLPPLVVLAIRTTRYLLMRYSQLPQRHPKILAYGLATLAITAGAVYCYFQYASFETTAFIFRTSTFMKTMGELVDPDFIYWTDRYGAVFVLGSIGLILACGHFKHPQGTFLGVSLFLFTATTFFRRLIETWVTPQTSDILFILSVILSAISLGIAAIRTTSEQEQRTDHKLVLVAIITWFIIWVSLARSGKRYDFFIGLPLAFGTASLLWLAPVFFNEKKEQIEQHFKQKLITTTIAITAVCAILFITPVGGNITRLHRVGYKMRTPIPSETYIVDTLKWVKENLPSQTVMAANWDYGLPLNVIAGIKTITDSDTFIPHWIHLYYRHVFCGQNENEVLSFLKTHGATHLLLTQLGATIRAHSHALVGSNSNQDRYFALYPLERVHMPIGSQYRMVSTQLRTPFTYIDFEKTTPDTLTLTLAYQNKEAEQILLQNPTTQKMVSLDKGGLALYFDSHTRLEAAFYIPPIGWNSFAIKAVLRNEHSDAFELIYTHDENVKIWKINYPDNIAVDEKYLATSGTPISKRER